MQRIKIAHLARWLEVGGTESVILNLCRLGSGRQWVVGLNDGPMRSVLESHGIEVRLAGSPEHAAKLLADADVVNVHWLEYMPLLFRAATAAGRPTVFTLHGLAPLPELPGPVLCTSRGAFDLQEVNAARRVLIPNAIDTRLFCPTSKKAGGPVRIIRVCRPIRCAEYFWAAIHRVLEAAPEAEVKLVGGPPFRLGRIESLGDRHDVHRQLAEADIFAYAPWPHEGTLDLVVLEAMASGLPCVLSDAPCVQDSVQSGHTGFLTPFGNAEAFAEAVLRLVRDRALRERMGREAAKVAQEQFDLRQRVSLYEKAYEQARAADRAAVPVNGTLPLAVVA